MNFNNIFKKDRLKIQNIIRTVTKENNEDVEQEIYIKVVRNAHKYKEEGKLFNWIKTIAYNASKDYLKSSYKKNTANIINDDEKIINIADTKTPEEIYIRKERQQRIINAIDSLDIKHKKVILLYEIEGYTIEEISKKINCPQGTVKSRLYYAKKELAYKLKDLL